MTIAVMGPGQILAMPSWMANLRLSISDILAVVRLRKRGRDALEAPNRTSGPSRGNVERAVSVFQVTRNRGLGVAHTGVVAIMNDRPEPFH
jgi:hypothetical protein